MCNVTSAFTVLGRGVPGACGASVHDVPSAQNSGTKFLPEIGGTRLGMVPSVAVTCLLSGVAASLSLSLLVSVLPL